MIAAMLMALCCPPTSNSPLACACCGRAIWKANSANVHLNSGAGTCEALLTLAFLLHQSLLMADAIVRTLVRRYITQKAPARMAEHGAIRGAAHRGFDSAASPHLYLLTCPVLGALVALIARWSVAPIVLRIIALWIASPADRALAQRPAASRQTRAALRYRIPARPWRCAPGATSPISATPEGHWLAPDNMQEEPPATAHQRLAHQLRPATRRATWPRTISAMSSTRNWPMQLQQQLDASARWIAIAATSTTGTTRERCEPMRPRYISTVDSGNLAAALVALKQGCLQMADQP